MTLYKRFSKLTDSRNLSTVRYSLADIMTLATISYLSDYFGYREMSRFCKANSQILRELLGMSRPIPSHVTFSKVLAAIPESEIIDLFNDWVVSEGSSLLKEDWLSGDGKVLCSTVTDKNGPHQNYQVIVSLFAQKSGLVEAISAYKNKDKELGETERICFLLDFFKDKGLIIRLDALHTQKKR